jgi:hypothetical protein
MTDSIEIDVRLSAISWHLQNNVLPELEDEVIGQILQDIEMYYEGQKRLNDPIGDGSCTFGEMVSDLKIEL